MATPVHALFDLMPAPAQPRIVGDISWEAAEAALGVSFSEQYKLFFAVYGFGSIDGELVFFSYRSAGKAKKFLSDRTALMPHDVTPFPMYPGGKKSLLPLGYDGYGYTIYCVVERGRMLEEEFWAGNLRFQEWIRFDGPFLDFLYRLLTGSEVYLDDLEPGAKGIQPRFVSVDPQ